ncbi:SIR2 family protein [Arthrobacter gengyunqii]|uniref:SIR2 family protein n=1 Tax=Arthrobacter gengyunqii TaxID=2886940 RepID=A0A9X1S858_9MICC|nr:SIR2 family protein [Arthrobacter gengyunqii]MCC3271091.1 SIR2 family protein [Arthrobacter gengyunqii]UOY96790.1 SIR2 family protein [Arthrobacter gengyunqii]
MGESHVFVTKGSLTNFACDAWLLPTDRSYSIRKHWRDAVRGLESAVNDSRDAPFGSKSKLTQPLDSWPVGEPLPVLTAVPYEGISSVDDLIAPLREFVQVAAESSRERSAKGRRDTARPVPLLGIPLFGTGGGGAGFVRGDVIKRLLEEARRAAAEAQVDIALVLRDEKDFAFAQELRKRNGTDWWPSLDPEVRGQAQRLADYALEGKLVPFMGAGVSMSAGAPSWGQLLDGLASEARLSEPDKTSLRKRSNLDQAGILRSIFSERAERGGTSFNQAIASRVDLKRYGLAPTLLATLGSREAITLNYDTLFEMASADAGIPRTVIPDGAQEKNAWLLKLHGSVTNPESIVLTRDDYLGFNVSRNALSALVKATLMTQHLLFVGFGLEDDHFHEILHDVRRALPRTVHEKDGIATALMLSKDPLGERMWSNQLSLVSMGPDASGSTARTLEIFLDYLVAQAADSHSYLLAEGYEHALSNAEQSLRKKLQDLDLQLTSDEKASSGGRRLEAMLAELGASSRIA